jgi:hypothetical protein
VCRRLAELRRAMQEYAAGFDPAVLTGADADRVVKDAAAIEHMAATIKGLAAAWVADTGVWRTDGDRSPAHHLARTTGTSLGQAADTLDTARRTESLPEVAAKARGGQLSPAQSSAIASAASADPSAQTRLLDQAETGSFAARRVRPGQGGGRARPRGPPPPDPPGTVSALLHRQ